MTPDNVAYPTRRTRSRRSSFLAYVLSLKLRLRRLRARAIALEVSARPRSDRAEGA